MFFSDGPGHLFYYTKKEIEDKTKEPISDEAVATMILAQAIASSLDTDHLAHAICMGVRMGLFGVEASAHTSIKDLGVTLDGSIGVESVDGAPRQFSLTTGN